MKLAVQIYYILQYTFETIGILIQARGKLTKSQVFSGLSVEFITRLPIIWFLFFT